MNHGEGAIGRTRLTERRRPTIAFPTARMKLVKGGRKGLGKPFDESRRKRCARLRRSGRKGPSTPPSRAVGSISVACVGHRPLWSCSSSLLREWARTEALKRTLTLAWQTTNLFLCDALDPCAR